MTVLSRITTRCSASSSSHGLITAVVCLALGHFYVWLVSLAAIVLVLRFAFSHPLGRLLTRALRRIDPQVEPRQLVRVHRLRLIMLFAYANWLFDCAALYASLHAVHASVAGRSVIRIYVLAQLVAQLAVLPGGDGTVELSLATGFAAFGLHHGTVFAAFGPGQGTVFAGVLLYRFLSCWGLIPVGWLGFILDRARSRVRTRTASRSGPAGPCGQRSAIPAHAAASSATANH